MIVNLSTRFAVYDSVYARRPCDFNKVTCRKCKHERYVARASRISRYLVWSIRIDIFNRTPCISYALRAGTRGDIRWVAERDVFTSRKEARKHKEPRA